jgi:hypothetical protein
MNEEDDVVEEDSHFLIDSAPPLEVEYTLACLDLEVPFSTGELRKCLSSKSGYTAQRSFTFSTRRLFDLGLANKAKTASGKPGHILANLGAVVREILYIDRDLYCEIMHYLHYTSYDGSATSRKLFWSYRTCCDIVWERKRVPPTSEIVTAVQSRIAGQFPSAYASRVGGNFNAGGVSSGWKPWLTQLCPSPFSSDGKELRPRQSHRFELSVLALDHVYRSRNYRYGDPVILDDVILDKVACVFFLDPICCRELLSLAARLTKVVRLADTFAGPSVTLMEPYTIESI